MKRKKKYQRGVDMKNITQVGVALIVALALTSCSDMDNNETLASKAQNSYYVESVSYTHLTLPTIYSV